jgi:hypothetical protein
MSIRFVSAAAEWPAVKCYDMIGRRATRRPHSKLPDDCVMRHPALQTMAGGSVPQHNSERSPCRASRGIVSAIEHLLLAGVFSSLVVAAASAEPSGPSAPLPDVGNQLQEFSAAPQPRPLFTISGVPVRLWAPVPPPYSTAANRNFAADPFWPSDAAQSQ